MKKYITRLMAMVLTLATMFTLFAVPASAALGDTYDKFYNARNIYAPTAIVDGKVVGFGKTQMMSTHQVTDKNTFTSDEFMHEKDIAAYSYYLGQNTNPYKTGVFAPVTDLNKLAQYMPYVSAETRAKVALLPGDSGEYSYFYAYTDKATALTRTQENDALKAEGRKLTVNNFWATPLADTYAAYKNQEIDMVVRGQLVTGITRKVSTNNATETSANIFWRIGNDRTSASNGEMWTSGSGQNDKMVHHILLGSRTYYYGADTYRNSNLETVVFPADLLSDHYVGDASDPKALSSLSYMTLRTIAGLTLGKEAIVLADHAFADNANLKSVIFPTEPARLYFEDGVFSNCPSLTIYAPAGGYIESYCKANGIKFQAIAHGYIEPKVTSTPTIVTLDHIEIGENAVTSIGWYDYLPIANYTTDFANSFAIATDAHAICDLPWDATFPDLPKTGTPSTAVQDAMVNDINRYRENRDGQFTMGTPLIGSRGMNRDTCWY